MSNSIVGPDPAALTDDEIAEAAHLIGRMALEVAGKRQHPSLGELAQVDPAAAFIYRGLGVLHAVLVAENERRTAREVAEGLAAIERHLGGEG